MSWSSYLNVLRTLVEDALRTLVGDAPQSYLDDNVGTSSGRRWDIILLSGSDDINWNSFIVFFLDDFGQVFISWGIFKKKKNYLNIQDF